MTEPSMNFSNAPYPWVGMTMRSMFSSRAMRRISRAGWPLTTIRLKGLPSNTGPRHLLRFSCSFATACSSSSWAVSLPARKVSGSTTWSTNISE